jgi:hypothetical protein
VRDAKRPRVPVEQARPEVMAVASEDRIRAIKVLRELTGSAYGKRTTP